MKKWLITFAVFIGFLALSGCSGPMDTRIDASTPEAYQKSLQAIRAKLQPDELKKFEDALTVVAFNDLIPKDSGLLGMLAAASNPEKLQGQMLAVVNGKTPREIIASAANIRKSRAESELKSVNDEIATLEKQKAEAAKSGALLDKIAIVDAKYYWSKNAFMPQPVIDFKVTNNTGVALSRIYYHGVVSTPGRSVPWVDEDFNNEMAGGLEPGESKRLQLSPNMFSHWGPRETQDRNDLVLAVKAVNAEGVDKKKLVASFDKADAERLAKLGDMKKELEKTMADK